MRIGFVVILVALAGALIFWKNIPFSGKEKEQAIPPAKYNNEQAAGEPNIRITNQWDLPRELNEISGLAWVDADRFACVQDEQGIIYIYNRSEKKIEKKIPFAGPGDFEGVAINGTTAYAVRADGVLYEIDINKPQQTQMYKTPLTVKHNVEGLTYDKAHNRLLLAIKNDEPDSKEYKGIYAFDLSSKKMREEPVIKIDLSDKLLQNTGGEKHKAVMPSAVAIHPKTGELYITDGTRAMLLVMDASGTIRNYINLGKQFRQPEGITFAPEGSLFISNEGGKGDGNILQVEIE